MQKYLLGLVLMLTYSLSAQELVVTSHNPFTGFNLIRDFYEGPTSGRVYAIGDGQVAYFENETWTAYPEIPVDYENEEFTAIATNTSETDIWIGTKAMGVLHFNGTDWVNYNPDNSDLLDLWVRELAVDADGVAWIGTDEGLTKIENGALTNYTVDNSNLPDKDVYDIKIDDTNAMWLANDGYITRIDGNNFTSWDMSASSILGFNPKVHHLDIGTDGTIWVGGLGGIASFDGTNWTPVDLNVGSFANVQSIMVDNDGTVFFGRTNNGLFRYTPITDLIISFGNTLPSGQIYGMLADSQNRKWTGGAGGGIREISDDEFVAFLPMIEPVVIDILCNGDANGEILLNVEVAFGSPTIIWEDMSIENNDLNPTGLGAGTYNVTVLDSLNLASSIEISISEPAAIEVSATITNEIQNSTKGEIELQVTGGVGEYTYEWSDPALMGANPLEVDAGMYSVTITDENGCAIEQEVTVDLINSVDDFFEDASIKVFPTITSQLVTVENLSEQLSITNVQIVDITGKIHLEERNVSDRMVLDLSSIPNGIYFIQLSFEDKLMIRKIIKN